MSIAEYVARDLAHELVLAEQRIEEMDAEIAEQARLLGLSGSREAALLARITLLEKVAEANVLTFNRGTYANIDINVVALKAAGYLGGGE